jgi:4-carboxymuconolactone decarboxylase
VLEQTRYDQGWERLKEIDGTAGERVIASLADICPDLGRYIVEFGFGDVYSRPGLSLRERELATIAALTALGTAMPQLKVHIAAGLHVGLSRDEIRHSMVAHYGRCYAPSTDRTRAASSLYPRFRDLPAKDVYARHAWLRVNVVRSRPGADTGSSAKSCPGW